MSSYYEKYGLITFEAVIIVCISIISIFFHSNHFNKVLEFSFFYIALTNIKLSKIQESNAIYIALFITYTIASYVYASYNGANIKDFLLIFKVFVYMIMFGLYDSNLKVKLFINIFDIVILTFLFTYGIKFLVLGNSRPILFYENNFELIFLVILYYARTKINSNHKHIYTLALLLIFLVSGSRSGLIILIFVLLFQYRYDIKRHKISSSIIFAILIAVVLIIIQNRTEQYQNSSGMLDRPQMFLLFLQEIEGWSMFNYFFGTIPITALSDSTASQFYYFKDMFSYLDPNTCYSVVFHAFILRVIFDHGIIGLIAIISFYHYLLKKRHYSNFDSFIINSIALLSGCSISGYNSIYFNLAFLICLSLTFKNNSITQT